jgi:hypothetical protein
LHVPALLVALGTPIAAQDRDQGEVDEVALRVTATQPGGWVGVDRGAQSGLVRGQRVVFRPRAGGTYEGTVDAVRERTALVTLDENWVELEPGTTGIVRIVDQDEPPAPKPVPEGDRGTPAQSDDGWKPGMPLLAEVGAVQPEDRPSRWFGRMYITADLRETDGERSDSFLRSGVDFVLENPWGRGGTVEIDGEFNSRMTRTVDDAFDNGNENTTRMRLDRANYSVGATRYQPRGWTAGRFLQYVPELGILDGFEIQQRTQGGQRMGASIGYQPLNNATLTTGEDFQVSAWYRWVADDSERFAVTGAVQKTLHNGKQDREMLFTKVSFLPDQGWSVNASAWIDRYTADDEQKDDPFELTRALASATRTWDDLGGMTVGLSRWRLPELLRDEIPKVTQPQLADGGADRLSWDGWKRMDERKRLLVHISAWTGEGENGGNGELGVRIDDLWLESGSGTFTAFAGSGKFTDQRGVRASFSQFLEGGSWDVLYELTNYEVQSFDLTGDQLVHHRVRATRSVYDLWGWTLSSYGELTYQEQESSIALGFNLTRGF